MNITEDPVDAAIETHNKSGLALRGVGMRERFPELGTDRTREVYAIADKVIALAWQLASESVSDRSLDDAAAVRRIVEAELCISNRTARRAVDEAFRHRGKL